MHPLFAQVVETLEPSFELLLGMDPVSGGRFPATVPKEGVYLFSERARNLYVGRTRNIRNRYGGHCRPGATRHSATFAFRLAREATGYTESSYRQGPDSREGLMENPEFVAAFDASKRRIREMNFRFVAEEEPTRQALLEIYCSVALETPYNNFATH